MNLIKYILHIDVSPLNMFLSRNESEFMLLVYNNDSIIWRHVSYFPNVYKKIEIDVDIFNYILKSNKLKECYYCSSISEVLEKLEIYDIICESLI